MDKVFLEETKIDVEELHIKLQDIQESSPERSLKI